MTPRPASERRCVREAVAHADPAVPREPLARDLAHRVVAELDAYLSEGDDPIIGALGELKRQVLPSPVRALATDPDIDTLALFVDRRVAQLRSRSGRYLSPAADAAERRAILVGIEGQLVRRYLRHMRSH